MCSIKMRTLKKYFQRILVITSLALFYNEFLVYYLVLSTCQYPPVPPGRDPVAAMILADTHLLGARNGHWFDKLRREWQMHRTFQTAQTLFKPEHVFFLGIVCPGLSMGCVIFCFQVTCLMKENGVLLRSLTIM